MIRVAFTAISGKDWTGTGIHNYYLNLVRVLLTHSKHRVQPVIFAGEDAIAANLESFYPMDGVQIIRTAEFNEAWRGERLRRAVLFGRDRLAAYAFSRHGIDVAFESAQFLGWRFPLPTISWLPDFQHRNLRHLFSLAGCWKRDLGFRVQVLSGRQIMLSSEDSRRDCERFFPRSIGRTSVVRFSVAVPSLDPNTRPRAVADSYRLPESFFYLPNQFWKHKNHRLVIEALAIAKREGYDFVVATSGRSDDYRHPNHFSGLQSLVKSYGLSDNFRFLGLIPRDHVIGLLRSCAALINPSLSEGWSTTVEEAKMLGVPMLLSDLPVHREQAGGSASFFDPRAARQLTTLMAEHRAISVLERRNLERAAIARADDGAKRFAEEFSGMVELAAGACKRPQIAQPALICESVKLETRARDGSMDPANQKSRA